MKESEMDVIAEIMWNVVNGKSVEKVREEVAELSRRFNTVKYAFEESPAYDFA
jgi:glycine/serine hydroxymethyltransferase